MRTLILTIACVLPYSEGIVLCFYLLAFGSEPVVISGDLSEISFDGSQKMYRVAADVEVPEEKTVHIPAGTILLFESAVTFSVKGECRIEGTKVDPVIFTSINDPAYAIESTAPPSPFDWNGIVLDKTAHKPHLSHLRIKYAQHPLVSGCPDLTASEIWRIMTKDAFFVVTGDTIKVSGAIPFSYGLPVIVTSDSIAHIMTSSDTNDLTTSPALGTIVQQQERVSWWKRTSMRWTLAGGGTGAVLAIAGCAIGYSINQERFNRNNSICQQSDISSEEFLHAAESADKASDNMRSYVKGGIAGSIVGVMLLTGFGITLMF